MRWKARRHIKPNFFEHQRERIEQERMARPWQWHFALLPVPVGSHWVWLEWVERERRQAYVRLGHREKAYYYWNYRQAPLPPRRETPEQGRRRRARRRMRRRLMAAMRISH